MFVSTSVLVLLVIIVPVWVYVACFTGRKDSGVRYGEEIHSPYAAAALAVIKRRRVSGFVALVLLLLIGIFLVRFVWPSLAPFLQHLPTSSAEPRTISRIEQLDRAQYSSEAEYTQWAPSACSTTAMTMVLNSFSGSQRYRITDILHVQIRVHEITPAAGLLEEAGIARTVGPLGFQTQWGHHMTLDRVIAAAQHGPVIVGFPPQTAWPGGHLLLVTGGGQTTISLIDPYRTNLTSLPRSTFLQYWRGFSAVITPL